MKGRSWQGRWIRGENRRPAASGAGAGGETSPEIRVSGKVGHWEPGRRV